jgi:glycosyltransferase involved in cell wall biosynthesis
MVAEASQKIVLSIVVPMYNEADGIDAFFARIEPICERVVAPLRQDYEIVCVDDGSTDDTLARMRAHQKRNPAIRIVSLTRNFGKDIALTAGLDHAQGSAVVPIDSDLQDPPELIPELFARWLEGNEVVYATRVSRDRDSLGKRVSAGWFYRVHNLLAEVKIPENTGDFRLIDQRVVEALRRLPERNRFMKGLFAWVGFRTARIEYSRAPRAHGVGKWKPWRLWNFGLDGITSSSTVPLRIWSYVGGAIFVGAFAYAAYLIVRTMFYGVDVPGYASLMVVMLFMGGMTLLTLGIIGEYLGRIYTEVKARPLYLVRERIGWDRPPAENDEWNARSTPEWVRLKTGTGTS